jgi:phosphoglycerate dehydrogenase-like enzyme
LISFNSALTGWNRGPLVGDTIVIPSNRGLSPELKTCNLDAPDRIAQRVKGKEQKPPMSPSNTVRVFYFSYATPDLYAMIRDHVPPGFDLVTLERDDDAERIARIRDCEIVIVAGHRFGAAAIAAAKRLRLVLHQGVGYHDTVDTDALKRRDVALAITPEGTAIGVSEHTVMLMLAVCKRLPFVDSELRAGRFHVNALRAVSRELSGRTIGDIGMGRIGQAVATRLRAWETTGIYADPIALTAQREAELGLRRTTHDELLAAADIVTLHLPLTAQTRGMIDAAAFARMKPGAMLINAARGGIVDEAALVAALDGGRLAGAGLDVFTAEPTPADHPLFRFPNVVLTPHIAAGSRDAFHTKMSAIFANAERFYRGETLLNHIDLS